MMSPAVAEGLISWLQDKVSEIKKLTPGKPGIIGE